MSIIHGDCLEIMKTFPDNHFSAIVCDPPYGIKFMGKEWDHGTPGIPYWKEALRISKPGTFLLAFGGSRTHHRLTCAIEDAGWEIRDCLMWLYGSGFPKSHDISKAIDKRGGCPGLIDEISSEIKRSRESRNLSIKECDYKFCNSSSNWSWFEGRPSGCHLPSDSLFNEICNEWPELRKYFERIKDLNREVIKTTGNLHKGTGNTVGCFTGTQKSNIPISQLSKTFLGYGTCLKPAWEPIIMAMKPCDGTFAHNAEKWKQAGINIDECRIAGQWKRSTTTRDDIRGGAFIKDKYKRIECDPQECNSKGRWPANLILDEKVSIEMGEKSRYFYCAKASPSERNEGLDALPKIEKPLMGEFKNNPGRQTPKSSPVARANFHPCIKPIRLMEYLIKLVMPPEGLLLDPFAGSGTTILAAQNLGFESIGIEKEEEYCKIANARLAKN